MTPPRHDVSSTPRRPTTGSPHPFIQDDPPNKATGPPLRRSELETRRILVVEDDPTFAKLLTTLLRTSDDFDYDTLVTDSIQGALRRLSNGNFDVIIADLGLPDSKEFATIEALHEAAPEVPIVVLTGTAEGGVGPSLEAVRRGAAYFLRKGNVDRAAVERGIHYATERRSLSELLSHGEADPDQDD